MDSFHADELDSGHGIGMKKGEPRDHCSGPTAMQVTLTTHAQVPDDIHLTQRQHVASGETEPRDMPPYHAPR